MHFAYDSRERLSCSNVVRLSARVCYTTVLTDVMLSVSFPFARRSLLIMYLISCLSMEVASLSYNSEFSCVSNFVSNFKDI
jgi:hypothetical protein